jgi:sec-independent protein translocase protein TatA
MHRKKSERCSNNSIQGDGVFENIGGTEILVILFVVFIFFGPKKLPELGKNLGRGLREMRKAMRDIQDDVEKAVKDDGKAG